MESADQKLAVKCSNLELAKDDASKLEIIQQEIENCKAFHNALQNDIAQLKKAKHESELIAQEFNARIEKLQQSMEDDQLEQHKRDLNFQKQLKDAEIVNDNLREDERNMKDELMRLEEERSELEKQLKVSFSMPEKQWCFNGKIEKDGNPAVEFDLKPCIHYPIKGGSAVITFEDETVTNNILEMEEHVIELGDCQFKIKAQPLKLPMLKEIEIQTQVCKRRILVSDIPKFPSPDQLLDKLELYFSKQRNGGGEVENTVLLEDSGNVIVTFVAEGKASPGGLFLTFSRLPSCVYVGLFVLGADPRGLTHKQQSRWICCKRVRPRQRRVKIPVLSPCWSQVLFNPGVYNE
ncbi:hypothetical protein chiPu_0008132 [Chiloscyllium punctatum]|uniref:NID domain-containing protein n=1 Tax=Chiloscyllium punctatum TaxID=137246 RepID=A0A401SH67_CHIPU|nr:hypothetical protein [Chiloscyllium punctatum]